MLEKLQQFWVSLTDIVYWVGILALIGVIFAICYYTALNRLRRRTVASQSFDLDPDLHHLETQTEKAQRAVATLLKKAKLSRAKPHAQDGPVSVYIKQGKPHKIKVFLSKLFTRSIKSEEPDNNPYVERLRLLKEEIKQITADIDAAIPWLQSVKAQRKDQVDSTPLSGNAMGTIVDLNDDNVDEPRSSGFYRSDDAPAGLDAQADWPTIDHSYYRDSRQIERADIDNRVLSSSSARNIAAEIIELYNLAVTNTPAREQFRDQYQPIRVGTVNAVERRQNPTIEAEFRETTDGDFFALDIPGENEYAVVPRLGLTIEAVSYNAGALGQVFNNPPYNPKLFYSRYCVRQPAIFKHDGDRWELLSPGDLDLGPGD